MKRILAEITDQQAPPVALHTSLPVNQWLSINAQRTKGKKVFQRIYRAMMVNSELNQLLNRLARIQPTTPTLATGGLIWDLEELSMVVASGIRCHLKKIKQIECIPLKLEACLFIR